MTEISFYTHADDKLAVARQLTAKAWARGMHVMLYAPNDELAKSIDTLLWTTPAISFVPHTRDTHALAPQTPVVIGENVDVLSQADVMINLHQERPPAFSRFTRLLEIVGLDENEMEQGRQRYRFYRERGYALNTIDLRNTR